MRLYTLKCLSLIGFFAYVGTEVFGSFQLLSSQSVWIYWAIIFILFVVVSKDKLVLSSPSTNEPINKTEIFIWVAIVFVTGLLGFIALSFPPNNYDSMTYHMSRVAHWVQNGHVNFYATHIPRQLWSGPFAEYLILQVQLLTGSDYFANFIQWVAMFGSLIGVSLLANRMGIKRKGQLFTVFLTATIPMGIMQATSTQNDYVVAFWLVCLAVFIFRYFDTNEKEYLMLAGVSCGLGALTKGTFYIFGGIFVFLFILFYGRDVKKILSLILVLGAITLLIISPQSVRNYQLGGDVLAPTASAKSLKNERFGIKESVSLISRNIGSHLDTPIKPLNRWFEGRIADLHDLIDIDINDPEISTGLPFIIHKGYEENSTGNFRHLLLLIGAVCVALFVPNLRRNKDYQFSLFYFVIAFITLALYIKWQPWVSRLQVPIFVMVMPFIGGVADKIDRKGLICILTFIFLGCSITWLLKNPNKRMVSSKKKTLFNTDRRGLQFIVEGDREEIYKSMAQISSEGNCRNIGFISAGDSWEYPLWIYLGDLTDNFKLKHISVTNKSKKYEDKAFKPCAVVRIAPEPEEIIQYQGQSYTKIYQNGRHVVYR